MNTYAQQVAEAIHAEATSGSGLWDELGGPSATITHDPDSGTWVVTITQDYDEVDELNGHVTVITVTCGEPGKVNP